MSGPTEAEIRQVLASEGIQVGKRGRLSADQHAAYERIMTERAGYVTDIDAPADEPGPGPGPGPEPEPATRPAEQRPRSSRRESRAGARARGMWDRYRAGAGDGRARKPGTGGRQGGDRRRPAPARPWLPTAGVITTIWSRCAFAAGAIPPLQRVLAAQAPMAGVVFESRLKHTIADRLILQPFARAEDTAETMTAMVGVPVLVGWISLRGGYLLGEPGPDGNQRPLLDDDGMPVWDDPTQVKIGMLRYALASWLQVSRRYAADVIAQAEENIQIGREADQLIRWLFSPPDPSMSWNDVQREAAARAAQFTDAAAPPGPDEAAPRQPTAFMPALTASVLPRM